MNVPSPSYYQYVDLSQGLFFDYRLKAHCIVVKVYDSALHCIKKQEFQSKVFAKLPLFLPEGKNAEELFSWIVGKGFVPSLDAPGGFASPTTSAVVQRSSLPADTDLAFWTNQEEAFFCVKNLTAHGESISALSEVSPYLFVSGDDRGTIIVYNPNEDFRCLKAMQAHHGKIYAISPVGIDSFATASTKVIKIWTTEAGELELAHVINAHTGDVSALLMTGGFLVSASHDKTIKIWNPETDFSLIQELKGHQEAIELLFEHSWGLIISASLDGTIKIWDRKKNFACTCTISGHEESVIALDERKDGALVGSLADGRKMIWDIATGQCLETTAGFKPHFRPIVTISSCGLVAMGEKNKVRLWHPKPPRKSAAEANSKAEAEFALTLLDQHPGYAALADFVVAISPTQKQKVYVFLKLAFHFLKMDDEPQAEECFKRAFQEFPEVPFVFYKSYLFLHRTKKEALYQLCINMINTYENAGFIKDAIAAYRTVLSIKKECAYFDKLYSCYQQALKPQQALETGLAKAAFLRDENHLDEAEQTCLALMEISSEDSRILEILADIDERKNLKDQLALFSSNYEREDGEQPQSPPRKISDQTQEGRALAFQELSRCLVSRQLDALNKHLATLIKATDLEALSQTDQVSLLAYLHIDYLGRELARVNEELETAIAAPPQKKNEVFCVTTLTQFQTTVHAICEFEPNFFAAAGENGLISAWGFLDEYRLVGKFLAHRKPIYALCSPRLGLIVSASGDMSIKVWNEKKEFSCEKTLLGHEGAVYDLLQLDGDLMASASEDKTIRIWDVLNFNCANVLKGHEGPVVCIKKLSNGTLVSASHDQTVRFWDPANGFKCIHVYRGLSLKICSLAVTNGDNLAIGYINGHIEILDTKSHTPITTLKGHADAIHSLLSFSTGYLFSASADNTIRSWDLLLDEPLVQTLGSHHEGVRFLYHLQNGHLISSSKDQTMKVWSDDV